MIERGKRLKTIQGKKEEDYYNLIPNANMKKGRVGGRRRSLYQLYFEKLRMK